MAVRTDIATTDTLPHLKVCGSGSHVFGSADDMSWQYRAAHLRWADLIATGGWPCATCHRPISADDDWHLEHTDAAVALHPTRPAMFVADLGSDSRGGRVGRFATGTPPTSPVARSGCACIACPFSPMGQDHRADRTGQSFQSTRGGAW